VAAGTPPKVIDDTGEPPDELELPPDEPELLPDELESPPELDAPLDVPELLDVPEPLDELEPPLDEPPPLLEDPPSAVGLDVDGAESLLEPPPEQAVIQTSASRGKSAPNHDPTRTLRLLTFVAARFLLIPRPNPLHFSIL